MHTRSPFFRLLAVLVVALSFAAVTALASPTSFNSDEMLLATGAADLAQQPQHAFALGADDDNDMQDAAAAAAASDSDDASANYRRPGRIILIRHGEKEKGGRKGLAPKGKLRAQCLKHVFGRGEYKVDYIMAQAYKPDGRRSRPYHTVKPLADHLGLKVDTHCEREQSNCVARRALKAVSEGKNVLICWQHKALSDIARAFGVRGLRYPPSRSDILFQLSHHGSKVSAIRSEECVGLDDDFRGWHGSKRMRPEDKLVDDESWAPGMGEHHAVESLPPTMDAEARLEAEREAEVLMAEFGIDELSDIFAPVGRDSGFDNDE